MDEDSLTAQEEMKALIDKMGALSKQVKEKSDEEKYLFKTEVKKLQELLSCSQNREDTMTVEQTERLKASMYRMQAEFEQRTRQEETLKKQVRQAEETLADLRRQLEEKMQQPGAQPRAKFSVNLYRDVSKIRWSEEDRNQEVKGFICRKSGTKTFKFDEEKQSQFFITNSLWAMSDSV